MKNTEGNLRSKTEVALMKKLAKKNPPTPVKEQKEVFDLWGSAAEVSTHSGYVPPSKNVQKFKAFSERSMQKVRAVIVPHAGQSVNPALNAHTEILKTVVKEEEKQIEDEYRGSLQHVSHGGKSAL